MPPDGSESPAEIVTDAANHSPGVGYTGVRVSPTSFSSRPEAVKTRCAVGFLCLTDWKEPSGSSVGYVTGPDPEVI